MLNLNLQAISGYMADVFQSRDVFVGNKKARWTKVKDLKVGARIAIAGDGVEFDEIVSIKSVGREQVYDIEVEGTRNFVGNGIVAHNTYLQGTASVAGTLTLDSATSQINATNNRSLDLGFATTGRINFMTTNSYVDASGNISTNGQVRVGNLSSAPTALGAGSMYFDTTNSRLYAYNGSSWGSLGDSSIVTATNTSGGTLANRALVVFDNSNNNSVTTTTTAYQKKAYGVVNQASTCSASASCEIQIAGSANVTITNTTTVAKGDYVYTSATAGSAVTSAKLFDGMIGVVIDTSTSGSGYVKMVFAPQAQVTAGVAIDKGSKHNEYRLLSTVYSPLWDGTSPNQNIPPRGLMFDNFSDLTKIDAVNTTVSGASGSAQISNPSPLTASPYRMGLSGGQTMATSTTDNAGNTYLGSNTVNKVFYYDRTRDSSPQVQVELGIDPNWYNGVSLSVATTSGQFSQNTTIVKNPSLSTTYNGSLVKVTGTYATAAAARTIYITVNGNGNSFAWTDYNGNSGLAAITPGTAQTLTGAGTIAVTFSNAKYNPGDVFKIASWVVEPTGSTRGTKAQFPERSNIIATASSVDIIDADTQKLWMRFNTGNNGSNRYMLEWYTDHTGSSVTMSNGNMYTTFSGGTAGNGMSAINFSTERALTYRTSASHSLTINASISQRNTYSTFTLNDGYGNIVDNTTNDVSAAVIPNQPTQNVTVSGWGYIQGAGSVQVGPETVNFPYKFNNVPNVTITYNGRTTSVPTNLSSCASGRYSSGYSETFAADAITTTSFSADMWGSAPAPNYYAAGNYFCYTWTATGQVSPRQYVATATNGGATVINETDQSAINITFGTTYDDGKKVVFSKDGVLYYATQRSASVTTTYDLLAYYGIAGKTANLTATEAYEYYTAAGGQSIPSLWGSAVNLDIQNLEVTSGTSTIDGKSNTIYVSSDQGLTVLQEKQSGSYSAGDGTDEKNGSVKYYTKDYISEEMVGDIRGMWPLSANGAISMSDASVKGNTLTNNGTATAVTGVRGSAVSFNGTTQYLSCTDANCGGTSKLDMTGSFSTGLWVKPSTDGAIRIPLSKAAAGYYIKIDANNKLVGVVNTTEVGSTSGMTINSGNWYYLVVTYDGTNIKTYVNGVLTASGASSAPTDTASAFYIGSYDGSTFFFTGSIDEPFVTANALTAGQIKHMYEVGYRALQNHSGGDTNQQLGGTTNVVGDAKPDYNNQFMYVGTNSTTLGALSKIDLNSDTNVKTYNSSANVPAGGALLIDEDTKSLAVGYNLEAVGSATTGVKTMGQDDYATATSGNFVSKTLTTPESFNQAYLWAQYTLDSSDASNTVAVWASNDGGTNYYQCNLTNTDANQTPSEYEYFCQFNTAGSTLKTKFVFARGSTKTNTYLTRYGTAWVDSASTVGGVPGNGLYTNNNATVANGSYIDVAHNQGTNDAITDGWVYLNGQWKDISTATESGMVTASNATLANGDYLSLAHNQNTFDLPINGIVYNTSSSRWEDVRTATQSGAAASREIAAFNGACPVGWTEFTDARGRYIVGNPSGGTLAATVGTALTDQENRASGTHTHAVDPPNTSASITDPGHAHNLTTYSHWNGSVSIAGGDNTANGAATRTTASATTGITASVNIASFDSGSSGSVAGTNAPYIQLTYCSRNSGSGTSYIITQVDNNTARLYNFSGSTQSVRLSVSTQAFQIVQQDTNTVRLYNYSGSTQNLRLDVITGGLGRNLGTVSLAPSAADVDTQNNLNSIWVNKTGTGGTLLKLQQSGTDVLNLSSTALTLTGNFLPGTDNTYSLGASSSARWKDIFVGPGSVHFQSKSTDAGYPSLGLDYAMGINTAGSLVTSLNGTSLMTINQSGTVAIPRNATISGTLSMGPMLQVDAGTCDAAAKGKQYYDATSNSYYFCNGTAWGAVATPETSGQIAAFATACPTGWTEYTAARGRTVVGTPGSGTNAGTVGTALTNLQDKTHTHTGPSHTHTGPSHQHTLPIGYYGGDTAMLANAPWGTGESLTSVVGNYRSFSASFTSMLSKAEGTGATGAGGTGNTGTSATSDVIPYIQLTYCSKNAGADLAEWVPTSEDVSAATIVSVDPANNEKLIASRKPYDSTVVGIIATKPGWLIGDETPGSAQMALAGRVPTRVTLKNGDINRGDAITTSDIAGVGMKATLAGSIIGKAMEPLNEQSALTDCGNGDKCGVIAVFVNVSFYDPATSEDQYDTLVATSQFIDESIIVSDTAEVGDMVNLSYSYVGDTDVGSVLPTDKNDSELTPVGILGDGGDGQILQKIRLNGVLVGMKSLITSGVTEVNIASTSAEIHKGDLLGMSEILGKAQKSTTIEPIIGKALEDWSSESGKTKIRTLVDPGTNVLAIYAASTETLINIATISAQMDKLTADVSTILSELPQIKSDIEMLKEEMASVSARLAKAEESVVRSSEFVASNSALFSTNYELLTMNSIDVSTMSAQFGTFTESLKVIGTTQLANTSIGGSLTVGLLHFDDLKAEISSLTGLVTILGDATVSGQLRVEKGIVLKDKTTGEDYCVQIDNGEIVKTKGSCE